MITWLISIPMAETDRVLVDTSAFFALLVNDDTFHERAVAFYSSALESELELWTTSYVLSETIALLQRRFGFDSARTFSTMMEERVQVHWVDAAVHASAWRRYAESRGAGMNLVDWTVAVVAENMDARIFTFDSDFSNRGLSVVPRSA